MEIRSLGEIEKDMITKALKLLNRTSDVNSTDHWATSILLAGDDFVERLLWINKTGENNG
jgi:hypothetical protein